MSIKECAVEAQVSVLLDQVYSLTSFSVETMSCSILDIPALHKDDNGGLVETG